MHQTGQIPSFAVFKSQLLQEKSSANSTDFEDIDEDEENENGVAASGTGTVPEDDDGSEGAMDA